MKTAVISLIISSWSILNTIEGHKGDCSFTSSHVSAYCRVKGVKHEQSTKNKTGERPISWVLSRFRLTGCSLR